VHLNGVALPVKSFLDYVNLYLKTEGEGEMPPLPIIHEKFNDRWEVVVSVSDGQFQQVSFVNSIATIRGGTHVNHVSDQITKEIVDHVKKKNKVTLKPFQVKNHLWVFVNCLIENPSFDSQTKCTMTLKPSSFGSKCEIGPAYMKKVLKCGLVQNVLDWANKKNEIALRRQDGAKKSRINIPKLDDANDAGGKNGKDCTLILTEGDSAKALAVSGLSIVGRDRYGVFPLRGKLLNVREASHKQVMENAEITALKKIMGLQTGKEYTDVKSLRYGHIMIMADQDHDGSHIKGLFINFIHSFWPSLLKLPGFLLEFVTPIVKVSKGKSAQSFFTIPEYVSWKDEHDEGKNWNIKYYKGLGTSTSKEAKEYFSDLDLHQKEFTYDETTDDALIDLAFSKKKADMRKVWLNDFDPGTFLDHTQQMVPYADFINKELILFSLADNERSIPCFVDGLKPSQRKVLFSCFKRKLKNEIKVAQLAGYVSEHSAYHHGEASLQGTIVNMAQDFVSSNNINLLVPAGQFGTRLLGGKDAASPRYIFTHLHPITRATFHEADDAVLDFMEDDGLAIEPKFYVPVIPFVLVNGSDGIGTGWSSQVPSYNPRNIVENLKRMIAGEEMDVMDPWYRGFKGEIKRLNAQKFSISGIMTKVDETTLHISELPIGQWTNTYTDFLVGMAEAKPGELKIESFVNHCTESTVDIQITLTEEMMKKAEEMGLEKKFKMVASLTTSNMNLFNAAGKITKYDEPTDIIREFYPLRLDLYEKRKASLLSKLGHELKKLDNKTRFILAVINEEIVINNRKRDDLIGALASGGYDMITDKKPTTENEDDEDAVTSKGKKSGYDYLLKMPMWNLTKEKVDALCVERDQKQVEYNALDAKTPQDLWNTDLDTFLMQLDADDEHFQNEINEAAKIQSKLKGKKKAPAKKKKKTFAVRSDDEDDDEMEDSDDDFVVKPKKKRAASKPKGPVKSTAAEAAAKLFALVPAPAAASVAPAPAPAPAAVKKAAPKKAAKKATKKVESEDEDDAFDSEDDAFDSEEEVMPKPKARKAAAAPAPAPAPAAIELESEEEEESDEDELGPSLADKMAAMMSGKAAAAPSGIKSSATGAGLPRRLQLRR
jgi:DNA topoisomerase-2